MNRLFRRTLVLLATVLAVGCASVPKEDGFSVFVPPAPGSSDPHVLPSQCASGCDVKPKSVQRRLSDEEIDERLALVDATPVGSESDALDELLFYGAQVRARLGAEDAPTLSAAWHAFLTRELRRTYAVIEMRVVDENGEVRAWMAERRVPLGVKQHLHLDDKRLPGLEASGTVLRTSLYHLWTRI
jgi:hypothetical protein